MSSTKIDQDPWNLAEDDMKLINTISDFLRKHYKKNRHHVASALVTEDNKVYCALHLDTKGFDVCAETICISNALIDGKDTFKTIVAVIMSDSGEIEVINPCGNCRQMLISYAPGIQVITNENGILKKKSIEELLPLPY